PAAFGELVAAAVIVGFVLSIFTVTTLLALLTFPAASVTVWEVDATALPSALSVSSGGQAPAGIPDNPSVQVKCTVTSSLYQPAAFGELVAAAVIVGGGLCIFTVTTLLALLTFPAASVTVWEVDATALPSALSV